MSRNHVACDVKFSSRFIPRIDIVYISHAIISVIIQLPRQYPSADGLLMDENALQLFNDLMPPETPAGFSQAHYFKTRLRQIQDEAFLEFARRYLINGPTFAYKIINLL